MSLQKSMNQVIAYGIKLGLEDPRANIQEFEGGLFSLAVSCRRPRSAQDAVVGEFFRPPDRMTIEDYVFSKGCVSMDMLHAKISTKH